MYGAVVISWGNTVRGREAKAIEVFGKALAHFDALAKAGRVHGHQEFNARTGPQGGFMIVTGELDELVKIQNEEETLALTQAGGLICENFRVNLYEGGTEQATTQSITRYMGVAGDLGYLTT